MQIMKNHKTGVPGMPVPIKKSAVPNRMGNKATFPPTATKSPPPSQTGACCCTRGRCTRR
ncbi:hypothetical protein BVRB_019460 [Beta vulgaris subsp. vulgaris]|uniref:Uncharacterized protein n=1 Tax=Beta vulgaris subsp. vulgaris TaxID=3555 RepID=A0A0J7YN34_BETVV|nr:hypothetical protein BVRB_019460 [Beta vulgaris subsp. vulgaris]